MVTNDQANFCAAVLSVLLMASTAICQTAPPPVLGSTKISAGIPTGPSPDGQGKNYSVDVYYFNADVSLGKSTVEVPNIPVTAGLPNPTAAQILAARTAKAKAIVDAINAAKLNGVTAKVDLMDPTQYTVDGVRQSIGTYKFPKPGTPGTYLGAPITRTPGNRVTGELGNGEFNFKQGTGGSGSGSMYQGSMNGNSNAPGTVTSGLDASGFQSVAGFGFIDYTTSIPIDYTVSIQPTSGMTSAVVLADLGLLFNQTYASSGYTATFDSSTGWLSIDQPLGIEFALFSSDSDTSLDLMTELISVPEPASVSLLALGALALLAWRRSRIQPKAGSSAASQ